MMRLNKWIASCFGIGYLKGGGSIAAAVTVSLWFFFGQHKNIEVVMIVLTAAVILIGIASANVVEKEWGKDSSKVVMDEVAGMCVSVLFVPVTVSWMIAAFVLFRFFDIVKPLYIRKTENLPEGWGVMADDVLAGIYANVLLQVFLVIRTWQHL